MKYIEYVVVEWNSVGEMDDMHGNKVGEIKEAKTGAIKMEQLAA